jgi:hypothetical protein
VFDFVDFGKLAEKVKSEKKTSNAMQFVPSKPQGLKLVDDVDIVY